MSKPVPNRREAYRHFATFSTRWMDNDASGHVREQRRVLQLRHRRECVISCVPVFSTSKRAPVIGLVVETHCNYFNPLEFPNPVDAALRVGHIGTSSARYEIGLFAEAADLASAQGHFVHVYVDRAARRAVPIGAVLEQIVVS